jgi:hypothetical protein
VASLLPLGVAWAGGEKWGDTGNVAAVTIESRTIVVEIPRGKDSLTVGAEVLPNAVIQVERRAIDLSEIRAGDLVRIEWSRGEGGDVAHKIVVIERAGR